MHKSKEDVARVFHEKLGTEPNLSPSEITQVARLNLRKKYREAEIGITGGNFLVADTGAVCVSENEGNARLSTTFPKTHIAIVGIEKIIPSMRDLELFWPLLATYGTGQEVTVYNTIFTGPRRPGEADFRKGWDELGSSLETAVSEADYASLARCTQYAHFTPELIIRAIWAGVQKLGWRGGRVLEPGIGTGLFPALMPERYREAAYVTGVELDPVTARIVSLLQPKARIINGDFARTDLRSALTTG